MFCTARAPAAFVDGETRIDPFYYLKRRLFRCGAPILRHIMTDTPKGYAPKLLSIWRGVGPALKNVQGLRSRLNRMLLVSTAIFICLTAAILFAFDQLLLDRYMSFLSDGEGVGGVLSTIAVVLMYVMVGILSMVVNLRIVVALISVWNEAMVGDIIRHFRPLPELPFSWGRFLRNLGRSLLLALRDLCFTLILLFVGMISVVGLPLVLLAEVFLSGAAIRASYVDVLRGAGEAAKLTRRRLRASIVHLGLLPTLLSLLPFVGWLLIPPVVVLQLIGFTWDAEQRRARTGLKQPFFKPED